MTPRATPDLCGASSNTVAGLHARVLRRDPNEHQRNGGEYCAIGVSRSRLTLSRPARPCSHCARPP